MSMFAMATKMKYRFPFRGMISVEDLWDLPMSQLDIVFKNLNKDVKQAQEESLMSAPNAEDTELMTKIEIVKFIFETKRMEAEAHKAAAANAAKRQRIMEVLAQKQDADLQNMSEEELLKALEEIG